MNRRYVALVLVAMATLSGCAMLDSGDTTDAQTAGPVAQNVTFPWAGIAGDSVAVEVTVENTGDSEATHEAALRVDGESVTSQTTTLAAGAAETLRLSHQFEEPGNYTLTVGDRETAIRVYDSPRDLFVNTDYQRGTRVSREQTNAEGKFVQNGSEYDVTIDETATSRTNYDEQIKYTITNSTSTVLGFTTNETVQQWFVDGTAYTKTVSEDQDSPSYDSEPSDEFDDESRFSGPSVLESLTVEKTDGQYRFRLEAKTPDDAREIWGSDTDEQNIEPEAIRTLVVEYRIDADLYRPETLRFDATLEHFDEFSRLELTLVEEIVSLGEPVDVEVPEEVRENT